MRLSHFAFLIGVCTSCQIPISQSDAQFQKILFYQDNRALPDSLYPFLRNPDNVIESRAIQALGQMQDTLAIDSLIPLTGNLSLDIRRESIFALGQIGFASGSLTAQRKIESVLIPRYTAESDSKTKTKILEALGKCGSTQSFELIQNALKDSSDKIPGEAAMAIARMAIRKIKSESLDSVLIPLLKNQNPDVRWRAVYALMRGGNARWADDIIPLLNDPDELVRMDAARALGNPKLDSAKNRSDIVNALLGTALSDSVWRVRVNAVNALGNFKFKSDDLQKAYFLVAFEGKKDRDVHVRISAIRSMALSYKGDAKMAEFVRPFAEKFIEQADWHEQAEILIALAKMFDKDLMDQTQIVEKMKMFLNNPNGYFRGQIAVALGETHSPKAIILLEGALKDTFGLVQNNALDALGKIGTREARTLIEQSLETRDLTLLSIVAGTLAGDETILKDKKLSENISKKIIEAYGRISPPMDVEARTGIFDALGNLKSRTSDEFLKSFLDDTDRVVAQSAAKNLEKISGQKFEIAGKKEMHAIDYAGFVAMKSRKPTATIETTQGKIEISFYFDDAPLTTLNFIKLAESRFFDGLSFHRVVPNFVIQGGDPLGTGWGGPGYSIRSEFSDLRYERGMVGMASAGRDTEGCQWFITHSPQAHLDGRYTIFAKVRSGMDVVDKIQVGDKILRVKIN